MALWRFGALAGNRSQAPLSKRETGQGSRRAEAPDTQGITTAKEYNYVPAQKLPPVQGISSYKPMADRTVRFAMNVWAGWAPIILANNGFKPGKVWKTPGGKDFKVELTLIDDPVAMRDAYAAGNVHIGWATLDMMPLFLESLRKDSRVMPRVYQQVDWSNGGDGIVVRGNIKTVADLRGKTLVLAQNSPSHYFALNALINAGVQPAEVNFKFTQDAFQAAAAFNADKSIAGCVSWAPDIYNLSKVKGNRMLVNTSTANKLIADVWFARADFAKDNPDVIEGLVRGIFDAMEELKEQSNKQTVAKLMAAGYSIPETDALEHAWRRAQHQSCRESRILPESEQPHQFRADLEHGVFPVPANWRGRRQGGFRPGHGLLDDPEARHGAEVRKPEERVRRAVRAGGREDDPGRERGDPHQDDRHSLLSELVGSVQESG